MKFEIYHTTVGGLLSIAHGGNGQAGWRWRLKGSNGEPIANGGESYVNKADCLHAIALVKSTSANTPVLEVQN